MKQIIKRKKENEIDQDETIPEYVKILRNVIIGLIIIFGGFAILRFSLDTSSPVLVVTSDSMEPTLSPGDLIFIRGVKEFETEVLPGHFEDDNGTIIVFWPSWDPDATVPTIHRVIYREYDNLTGEYKFMTKGDNNVRHDNDFTTQDRVIGIYIGKIPKIGYIKIWVTDNVLIFGIVILSITLILSLIYDYSKSKKDFKETEIEN